MVAKDGIGADGRSAGAAQFLCSRLKKNAWSQNWTRLPREANLKIRINGHDGFWLSCTPKNLKTLVLGFLFSEGIISTLDDVLLLRVCDEDHVAEVRLKDTTYRPPRSGRITSGCGGGVTFNKDTPMIKADVRVSPAQIFSLMRTFREGMVLRRAAGGVHASALCTPQEVLFIAEDIGRHNTLDRLFGECLLRGVEMRGRIVLTTGRISVEMVAKCARVGIPLAATMRVPTDAAVLLAQKTGITLVGRVRAGNLIAYTHPHRLGRPA